MFLQMEYTHFFKNHSLTGIVGGISSGKSNLLFNMINETIRKGFKPVCYFYHNEYKELYKNKLTLIEELEDLEVLRNSIIFIDEFIELLQLNKRNAGHTEVLIRIFAQLTQNNNKIVLCGVPKYYNGFISALVDNWILCKLKFSELVGGSPLKKYIGGLSGDKVGGVSINLLAGEFLYKGILYKSKYLKAYDKKKDYDKVFKDL